MHGRIVQIIAAPPGWIAVVADHFEGDGFEQLPVIALALVEETRSEDGFRDREIRPVLQMEWSRRGGSNGLQLWPDQDQLIGIYTADQLAQNRDVIQIEVSEHYVEWRARHPVKGRLSDLTRELSERKKES